MELNNWFDDSGNMFADLINTIPSRIFWKDRNSTYIGCNLLFAQDAGLEIPDAVAGKTDHALFSKELAEKYRADDKVVMDSGLSKINYEEPQGQEGGEVRWVRTSKVPLRNRKGEIYGVLGTYEDITELKATLLELEQHKANLEQLVIERTRELESANEELISINEELRYKSETVLRQKNKLEAILADLRDTQAKLIEAEKMASLGTLTAGVAHEINNPLNYINGAYQGLEDYFQDHGSQEAETTGMLLNGIKTGVLRASEIVKGLNLFSRDSQQLNEDCDLHFIMDNCFTMLHNQLKHAAVLDKQYAEEDIRISGNVGKLHQVFINVLNNAVQALEEEGRILVRTQVSGGTVEILIADNGVGIAEEDLARITDPFFTTKEPGEGTGLGLSITYGIIRDHGGKLHFSSAPGKGTEVRIELPLKKV